MFMFSLISTSTRAVPFADSINMAEISPQISTAAVIGWQSRDTLKYLAEPDPKNNTLIFKIRVDKTSSLFEIYIPIYLKLTEKRTPKVSVILCVSLSIIKTFSLRKLPGPTLPQPVQAKLSSEVLRLDFKLNQNITVLFPLYAKEQPAQGKTQSGVILDHIREISEMKSFSVYIHHSALFEAQLQPICNAINRGHYRFTRKKQLDLQSHYQGEGAKITHLLPQPEQVPRTQLERLPAYDEVPSSSLDITAQKRKRPRREPNDHDSETSLVEAETLKTLYQRMATFELGKESQKRQELEERVATLKKERMRLEKALHDQQQAGQALEKRNATEIKDIQERIKTAEEEIETLQKESDKIDMEGCDTRLCQVEEDLEELGEKCHAINEKMVTQDNLRDFAEDIKKDIGKRIMGDKD
ncbi:hypothetical protein Ddc_22756 [Ditylenchus destructor]|nr:hypothetical protein Ddc_22756 [Ditylenchus destructor]